MEYRLLSEPSNIKVSRIGLGTWAIGGSFWGGADDADSMRTIARALDMGINLIDTAPVYGFGESETVVGRAIREYGNRDNIVLATKCGLRWDDDGIYRDSSPDRLEEELHDSLKRLRTDHIDIYQVHWPDRAVPFEDTAALMLKFRDQGKIRCIGVSNYSVEQLNQFHPVAPVTTIQPPYNLFEQEIEGNVLSWAMERDVTVLGYGAICRGLLSGRVGLGTTFPDGDIRNYDPKFQSPRLERYLDAVGRLDQLARSRFNRRVVHLAVRWLLDRYAGMVPLWGARRPDQLDALPEIMNWQLTPEERDEVSRIVAESIPEPVTAAFMAPPENPDFS